MSILILLVSSIYINDPIAITSVEFRDEAACRTAGDAAVLSFTRSTTRVDVRYICVRKASDK